MNLISIIKSNFFLLFFISFFLTIILCLITKSYKILTSIIVSYLTLILLSGAFIFIQKKEKQTDRRQFVIQKKADAIILTPSSFLNYNDGRQRNEFLNYNPYNDKILFPLGTITNKNISVCEEDEGPVIKLSDRYGFFNEDKLWNFRRHNILLIGDSHANGECVYDTPYKILNEKFNIKTVTIGLGGNGPLTTHAATKEYLQNYDTDYIYYILATNDYSRENFSVLGIDFEREVSNKILLNTLKTNFTQGYFEKDALKTLSKNLFKQSQDLVSRYNDDISTNNSIFLKEFFSLRFLLRTSYNIAIPGMKPGIRFLNEKNEKLLIETYTKTNKLYPNKIIFIIRPNINCGIRDDSEYSYIRKILKIANIKKENILDTTKDLCKKKLWSVKGNHLNKEGYAILTNIIKKDFDLRIND